MGSQAAHDFKGLTDWVEVFRAGTHRDSVGRSVTFSRADLDQVVGNLNSSAPPPHVVTHKELYSPFRYGDVVEAKREGDALFVKSANIEPGFERLVASRRLPDRSVRLSKGADGWQLAHVAWLGAEPPAVEGMAPVQFAAPGGQVFDFGYVAARSTGLMTRALRRMREFLIDKYSVEDADRVMPEWEIEAAEEIHAAARNDDEPANTPSFSAPPANGGLADMAGEDSKKLEADFAAAQSENTALKARLAEQERIAREAECRTAVKVALDAGRLTPAQAEGAVEFMAHLAVADDAQFEFSAGEGKAKKTPATWFADFIAKLDPQVDLGESDAGKPLAPATADFAAPAGYAVDSASHELHRKVAAHRTANPTLSYDQALAAVVAQI